MTRVLAISSYAGLGGSELAFGVFLEHLPAGVEADVLLVDDGPLRPRLEELGFEPRIGPQGTGRPDLAMLRRFHGELSGLLADVRYDVTWAVGQKAALLAAGACRRRRVPMTWHKVDFSWDRLLARPLAVASSSLVAVSGAVADTVGFMRRRRPVTIVGPPVSLARPVAPDPDPAEPVIGTLARLVPYKGHHLMIEAAALLRREFPGISVLLAGSESDAYPGYPEELRELVSRLGMEGRVEMPGHMDAPDALERLTVFVNATYRDEEGFGFEGLSGAMLEASAASLPVVATRGGGTAEGVVEGETGSLVEAASPEAIAAAIRPYLADPALARRAGEAGRSMVEARFAPEVVSAELWGALRAAAQAGSSSS